MQIPRYEPSVGVPDAPNVRIARPVSEEAFGSGIGDAIQKAGHKLAVVAAQHQEENDRIQLSLMDAQHEAFVNDFLNQEKTNPDYEGTVARFQEANAAYLEQSLKSVPKRLHDYVAPMMQAKSLAYEGKVKGLFLEKQEQAGKAATMSALDIFVKNNDFAGYENEVNANKYLTPMEKEKLIQSGLKSIETNQIAAILEKDPYAKLNKEDYKAFDDTDWDAIQKDQRVAQNAAKQAFEDKQEVEHQNLIGVITKKQGTVSSILARIDKSILDNSDKAKLIKYTYSEFGLDEHGQAESSGSGGGSGGGGWSSHYGIDRNNPEVLRSMEDLIDNDTLTVKFKTYRDFRLATNKHLTHSTQERYKKYWEKNGKQYLTIDKAADAIFKKDVRTYGKDIAESPETLMHREDFIADLTDSVKEYEKKAGRKARSEEILKLSLELHSAKEIADPDSWFGLGWGSKKVPKHLIPDNVVNINDKYYVKPEGVAWNQKNQIWVLPPNGKDRLKPMKWVPDKSDLYNPD